MPVNLRDNELLLRCACHSSDHIAFLIHDADDSPGDLEGEADDWYLSVLLDPIQPWWLRLWRALWPYDGRFGMYAEIVLRRDDVRRLAGFIDRRLGPADPPPG